MGFLNPGPDDEYRIASQAQGGTTQLPYAGKFEGLLTSIPKGITAGVESVAHSAGDALQDSDLAHMWDVYTGAIDQSNSIMTNLGLPETVPAFDADNRATAAAANKVVSAWSATGFDPRVTGSLGRIASNTTDNLTIGAMGTAAGGPWGAASLLGGTSAYGDYLSSRAEGIDHDTAMQKAGVTGLFAAGSAFVPMKFGTGIWSGVGLSTASNLVIGAAQRAATSAVLDANGYKDMASQYRVFDGESMAADALLGAAFGALGHAHEAYEAGFKEPGSINPADVDAASAVSSEEHFNRSAPGIPTSPDVANAHVDAMRMSIDALAKGDQPDIPAPMAEKLVNGTLPDPNHDTLPMIDAAARTELPNYEDAVTPIDAVEPPVREPGEPMRPLPIADGEPAPRGFDSMTQRRIDNILASGHADVPMAEPDYHGNVVTMRDIITRMQQEQADVDKMAEAHEVAAACYISSGGFAA